jgi:hypothetical protein
MVSSTYDSHILPHAYSIRSDFPSAVGMALKLSIVEDCENSHSSHGGLPIISAKYV